MDANSSFLFKPPSELELSATNTDEVWRLWRQKFENFMRASGNDQKDDKIQLSMLLSVIGDEALRLYNTWSFAAADQNKLAPVLNRFEEYCRPKKNIVYERFQFWKSTQEAGENIDSFATRLRQKAKSCEFGEQEDSMIRDRVVLGCSDARLQERLLREPDLSLSKAVDLCRAAEATKAQMRSIISDTTSPSASVSLVRESKSVKTENTASNCSKCGSKHSPKMCPAFGKQCNACGKLNHFSKVCRTKPTHQQSKRRSRSQSRRRARSPSSVHAVSEDVKELHISTVFDYDQKGNRSWWINVLMNGKPVQCKLDTGAEANVLPFSTYKEVLNKPLLQKTNTVLTAYGNSKIRPVGVTMLSTVFKDRNTDIPFYVVHGDVPALLGLGACEALDLIRRVDTMDTVKNDILSEFSDVFTGIGSIPGEHHIVIDNTVPPVVHPPRRIPLTVEAKLKKTLDKLENDGIITKQDGPTDWVNSLLVIEKKDGSLRICLDPRDLNKAIKREHYHIPTCEEVLAKLTGKKVFTIIDMKDGFWQVKLDNASSLLCTFNTPYGRYSMNRLPFGISSAPEVFQKRNNEIFGDIPGACVVFDDLIVAGVDNAEHDEVLRQVFEQARAKGVKFNKDKIQYRVPEVKYLGHILSANGVRPDESKVKAIINMPVPEDKASLQRFLGMTTYLSKFIPNYSALTEPLRSLLKKDVLWHWNAEFDTAFERIKQVIGQQVTLKFFDVSQPAVIQTDASSQGIGSCLLQNGQPVVFASRSLTESEKNYAQIEKELLAVVFACEKFCNYIYGKSTVVQSDHKPLESIFRKPISATSPRLQRMLLRLLKYQISVQYVPGKQMLIADTLSRAFLCAVDESMIEIAEDIEVLIHTLLNDFPASYNRLDEFRRETQTDPVLSQLLQFLRHGFPSDKSRIPVQLKQFAKLVPDLYELDGLLFFNNKIVVPEILRHSMLQLIHEGHQGIEKCKALARQCLYWPGIGSDIEHFVSRCSTCNKFRREQQKEPLNPHPVPARPWQRIGADIFHLCNHDYLILIDYYSKWPEICLLKDKKAETVVSRMKEVFARQGIPEELVSDNMPFSSYVFKKFADEWNFSVVTSSPHYPQSNGLAERGVQTIKNLLKKSEDPALALLQYRNTPVAGLEYSPAQLCLSRTLRSKIPVASHNLNPKSVNAQSELEVRQNIQKKFYDRHTRSLPQLNQGDVIRVKNNGQWESGMVTEKLDNVPRSFMIKTESGSELRRNRRHLIQTKEEPPDCSPPHEDDVLTDSHPEPNTDSDTVVNTNTNTVPDSISLRRSTRISRQPVRFRDYCC